MNTNTNGAVEQALQELRSDILKRGKPGGNLQKLLLANLLTIEASLHMQELRTTAGGIDGMKRYALHEADVVRFLKALKDGMALYSPEGRRFLAAKLRETAEQLEATA